eukprot:12253835-Alexandrium_andersonii.AAC.1
MRHNLPAAHYKKPGSSTAKQEAFDLSAGRSSQLARAVQLTQMSAGLAAELGLAPGARAVEVAAKCRRTGEE